MSTAWIRLRQFVVYRILHIDDTPHRIAFGVAIGLFVAVTPTIGLQMVIGAMLATALRANKVLPVALAWITNPVTAVPVFYFNWLVGHALLSGNLEQNEAVRNTLSTTVAEVGGFAGAMTHLFDWAFWEKLVAPLGTIVPELVVGSVAVGLVAGLSGYGLAYWGVTRYRRLRKSRRAKRATLVLEPEPVAHEAASQRTRHSA